MSRNRNEPSETTLSSDNFSSQIPAGQTDKRQSGKRFWPLALLAVVLLLPFVSILTDPGGRVLGDPKCDGPKAYYQYGYFLGQCWREGTAPLWNPHIMLGIPFLGEGQASVFHPLSFLYVFMRPSLAMNWLSAISFVLTGVFFYGYLRALSLGRAASWCGAITWSFSTVMVSRIFAGHVNILLSMISIPMILMFWERYRSGGGVRQLIGIAVGYGLMILAFYPQVLYIFSLFFLLYVSIQSGAAVLDRSSSGRREGKPILVLGIFILLGIGMGAIQLLPSLDFVSRSFRQESSMAFCGTFSFAPENLLTLIAPTFFGATVDDTDGRYWGRNVHWEMWMYIGILPLLLAAAGAWTAPRRRRVALLICAAIFLILGLGKHTFLFPIIYKHLPFFDLFRGSSKFTLVTLFCLVTLSAYGFEALFSKNSASDRVQQRRLRIIAAGTGLVFSVLYIAVAVVLLRNADTLGSNWERFLKWVIASREVTIPPLTSDGKEFAQITSGGAGNAVVRGAIFTALSIGVIFLPLLRRWKSWMIIAPILLVSTDLLGVFLPQLRTFDKTIALAPLSLDESAQTPYPPRILVPFNPMPNMAMRSGYSSVFGYTGNTLKRYNNFISHLQSLDPAQSRAESRFMQFTPQFSMLGFDAIAFTRENLPQQVKQIGQLGDRILTPYYEVDSQRQRRAFLAAAPRYFSRKEDALAYALSLDSDTFAQPAIERSGNHLPPHPLEPEESVQFISFAPNRVELEVKTKHPRELVLGSMFERNWKVKINGLPGAIEPANYVFRAVQVPAGSSRVLFYYSPTAFYLGAAVTGLSIAVLLLIFLRSKINPHSLAGKFLTRARQSVE